VAYHGKFRQATGTVPRGLDIARAVSRPHRRRRRRRREGIVTRPPEHSTCHRHHRHHRHVQVLNAYDSGACAHWSEQQGAKSPLDTVVSRPRRRATAMSGAGAATGAPGNTIGQMADRDAISTRQEHAVRIPNATSGRRPLTLMERDRHVRTGKRSSPKDAPSASSSPPLMEPLSLLSSAKLRQCLVIFVSCHELSRLADAGCEGR
jgi:hypothetical protein